MFVNAPDMGDWMPLMLKCMRCDSLGKRIYIYIYIYIRIVKISIYILPFFDLIIYIYMYIYLFSIPINVSCFHSSRFPGCVARPDSRFYHDAT